MHYAVLALVALLIGFAKAGLSGVGMLNTPLLTWAHTPEFAVGVSLPLLLVGDIFVGWRFFGQWDKRVVLTMVPGALVGVIIGSRLLDLLTESEKLFSRVIGIAALCFAILQLVIELRRADDEQADEAARPAPIWMGVLAGALTAIVSTIAHQGALVSNLYLLSQRLTKQRFVATATGIYFILNSMKIIPYVTHDLITGDTLLYSLAAAPLVVLGGFAGAYVIQRIDPRAFARIVLVLVVLMGLKLAVWP
jgi:uncharacterized membrane protein YfcA